MRWTGLASAAVGFGGVTLLPRWLWDYTRNGRRPERFLWRAPILMKTAIVYSPSPTRRESGSALTGSTGAKSALLLGDAWL